MKHCIPFIFAFFSIILLPSELTAQTGWVPLSSGSTSYIWSVHFTDVNTGYAVTAWSEVLKTNNGGADWTSLTTGTSSLYSIYFIDSYSGYIVGDQGIILKTIDAGTTWIPLTSGTTNRLWSVWFTDSNTGYVVGDYGIILKTTDAGETWTGIESGTTWDLASICFTDANTGYAVGMAGAILKTTNGGTTWISLTSGTVMGFTSVFFTDFNTGYIVGYGLIMKTINAGATWTSLSTGTPGFLQSIQFCTADTGYIVGDNGVILKTINAGSTWKALSSGTTNDLYSAYFVNENIGYAVGTSGTILKTTTGGEPPPVNISGSITDPFGNPVNDGKVYLFNSSNPIGGYDTTDVTKINNGNFLANGIVNQPSILLAFPDSSQLLTMLPTYYGDTIYWMGGNTIVATDSLNIGTVSFTARPPAPNGNATISGKVVSIMNGKANDPIDNVGIIIKKKTNASLSGYTLTGVDGDFIFNNIETGDYSIYVDYPGIPMYLLNGDNEITIDNPDTTIQITARVDSAYIRIKNPLPGIESLSGKSEISIFPNPTTGLFTLAFENPGGENVTVSISAIDGRIVYSNDFISKNKKYFKEVIDLKDLRKGLYFVKVQTREFVEAKSIIVE